MSKNPQKDYHKATILQVVPSLTAGGVERGTIEIAKAISAGNYRGLVLSSGGPLVSKIESVGSEHIKLNIATKNLFSMYRNVDKIVEIIRKYEVDIVHARSRAPAWSSYFAAKKANVPFITTFHGVYNFSGPLKKLYNSVMTYGDRIIAVSDFVKEHILQNYNVDESKIRVIHRGIDHKYFDPSIVKEETKDALRTKYHVPKNTPVIFLPSRMTRWKGQNILVDALNLIKNKEFYCIIAGDLSKHPAFTKEISEMIQNYKLQGKVRLFGPEMDMVSLYSIADIILSTSIEPEAFGRVVIEGQAMEKIVIATNIGGASETIEDGVSGYHVSPKNKIELAEKISYILDNLESAELNKIRKNARKSAIKNFSLEIMEKKTLDVYKELL